MLCVGDDAIQAQLKAKNMVLLRRCECVYMCKPRPAGDLLSFVARSVFLFVCVGGAFIMLADHPLFYGEPAFAGNFASGGMGQ